MNLRIKSMIWNIRKQKTSNQSNNNNKKTESKKHKDSVSSFWGNFKHSNLCIIGVPEWEEKEQEIGNLFETIMKEKFPNLMKEIGMQVQEAQESQTRWMQRGPLQDTS